MEEYFLEVRNISKSFGAVQALQNVNFRIRQGQVYSLAGENGSGKSTLIKIVSGVYEPDDGEIIISGNKYSKITPMESIKAGIQVIYQDFSLFNNLTVAENITISYNFLNNIRFVNAKENIKMAKKILTEIGVDIDPNEIVGNLPIAQRQIIAICRALLQDAKLVIMDEPTTALTNREINSLYKVIEGLRQKNISVIFVSHKFEEVFAVAEYITVLRNGKNVIDDSVESFDRAKLSYYMTGRETQLVKRDNIVDKSKVICRVENFNSRNDFQNINFELFEGEILGITGLLGSGRTELAEALFGLIPKDTGKLYLYKKEVNIRQSKDAVKAGIGYIPEDRLRQGLFLENEIDRNIASTILNRMSNKLGFLKRKDISSTVEYQAHSLSIKADSLESPVTSLSGGNQQRVVLAKWLATNPKLLIMNCPTVGVDIGSKSDIHNIIRKLAEQGIGIILISDDLPEILQLCNRILVMNQGELREEFNSNNITDIELQEKLVST